MSRRRRNSSSVEPDSPPITNNFETREHVVEKSSGNQRPKVDSNTGQTGAFPGLEEDDGGLFYGPAADGIDYLRMVRSERKGIPDLLTSNDAYYNTEVDDGGYYFDGAYTAQEQGDVASKSGIPKAQEHYYTALLAHFRLIRATMNCIPPLAAIEALGSSRPISFPVHSKQAKKMWQKQLSENDPHPVQMACMDADSILQLAELITRRMTHLFRSNHGEDIERTGSWIWALLGRCPERGELGSDEISSLRDLARRAGEVSIWLENKQDMHLIAEDSDEDEELGDDATRNDATNVNPPRSSGLATDRDVETRDSDHMSKKGAILDAIITVVGEIYGQRDLLDLRRVWSN